MSRPMNWQRVEKEGRDPQARIEGHPRHENEIVGISGKGAKEKRVWEAKTKSWVLVSAKKQSKMAAEEKLAR